MRHVCNAGLQPWISLATFVGMHGRCKVKGQQFSLLRYEAARSTIIILFIYHTGTEHKIQKLNTHTHTFNGPVSGTTRVSRYQKGKTNLNSTEARDSEWKWHQLGHVQVCTLLQTDSHASTPPLSFYRPDALPAAQPTASKH